MIPKIIHYCWFGPKKIPRKFKNNIQQWKELCPEFEFKCWNQDNSNYKQWRYAKEAYDCKHWAFTTDVVRWDVLHKYGGFYLDCDVRLYKNLSPLCKYNGISVIDKTKNRNWCHTAFLGSSVNNAFALEMLNFYEDMIFDYKNSYYNLKDNVQYLTEQCVKHGFKKNDELFNLEDFTLLPSEYCLQKDSYKAKEFTDNTYAYHESTSLCYTPKDKRRQKYYKIKDKIWYLCHSKN